MNVIKGIWREGRKVAAEEEKGSGMRLQAHSDPLPAAAGSFMGLTSLI